jgi:hypothetical protein
MTQQTSSYDCSSTDEERPLDLDGAYTDFGSNVETLVDNVVAGATAHPVFAARTRRATTTSAERRLAASLDHVLALSQRLVEGAADPGDEDRAAWIAAHGRLRADIASLAASVSGLATDAPERQAARARLARVDQQLAKIELPVLARFDGAVGESWAQLNDIENDGEGPALQERLKIYALEHAELRRYILTGHEPAGLVRALAEARGSGEWAAIGVVRAAYGLRADYLRATASGDAVGNKEATRLDSAARHLIETRAVVRLNWGVTTATTLARKYPDADRRPKRVQQLIDAARSAIASVRQQAVTRVSSPSERCSKNNTTGSLAADSLIAEATIAHDEAWARMQREASALTQVTQAQNHTVAPPPKLQPDLAEGAIVDQKRSEALAIDSRLGDVVHGGTRALSFTRAVQATQRLRLALAEQQIEYLRSRDQQPPVQLVAKVNTQRENLFNATLAIHEELAREKSGTLNTAQLQLLAELGQDVATLASRIAATSCARSGTERAEKIARLNVELAQRTRASAARSRCTSLRTPFELLQADADAVLKVARSIAGIAKETLAHAQKIDRFDGPGTDAETAVRFARDVLVASAAHLTTVPARGAERVARFHAALDIHMAAITLQQLQHASADACMAHAVLDQLELEIERAGSAGARGIETSTLAEATIEAKHAKRAALKHACNSADAVERLRRQIGTTLDGALAKLAAPQQRQQAADVQRRKDRLAQRHVAALGLIAVLAADVDAHEALAQLERAAGIIDAELTYVALARTDRRQPAIEQEHNEVRAIALIELAEAAVDVAQRAHLASASSDGSSALVADALGHVHRLLERFDATIAGVARFGSDVNRQESVRISAGHIASKAAEIKRKHDAATPLDAARDRMGSVRTVADPAAFALAISHALAETLARRCSFARIPPVSVVTSDPRAGDAGVRAGTAALERLFGSATTAGDNAMERTFKEALAIPASALVQAVTGFAIGNQPVTAQLLCACADAVEKVASAPGADHFLPAVFATIANHTAGRHAEAVMLHELGLDPARVRGVLNEALDQSGKRGAQVVEMQCLARERMGRIVDARFAHFGFDARAVLADALTLDLVRERIHFDGPLDAAPARQVDEIETYYARLHAELVREGVRPQRADDLVRGEKIATYDQALAANKGLPTPADAKTPVADARTAEGATATTRQLLEKLVQRPHGAGGVGRTGTPLRGVPLTLQPRDPD